MSASPAEDAPTPEVRTPLHDAPGVFGPPPTPGQHALAPPVAGAFGPPPTPGQTPPRRIQQEAPGRFGPPPVPRMAAPTAPREEENRPAAEPLDSGLQPSLEDALLRWAPTVPVIGRLVKAMCIVSMLGVWILFRMAGSSTRAGETPSAMGSSVPVTRPSPQGDRAPLPSAVPPPIRLNCPDRFLPLVRFTEGEVGSADADGLVLNGTRYGVDRWTVSATKTGDRRVEATLWEDVWRRLPGAHVRLWYHNRSQQAPLLKEVVVAR